MAAGRTKSPDGAVAGPDRPSLGVAQPVTEHPGVRVLEGFLRLYTGMVRATNPGAGRSLSDVITAVIREPDADAVRGMKVRLSAAKGNAGRYGTAEAKAARYADYQQRIDALHARRPELSFEALLRA